MAKPTEHEPELTEGEAVTHFEMAVKDHPDATSHFNLGSAFYAAHNLDAAFNEFQSALKLAPGLDHAHYFLGAIYKIRGDADKARQEFETVMNGSGHMMLKNQASIQLKSLKSN
ncbi:MAG: tetratricopeptide repeat protein [Acidobacteriota bacterium]